MQKTLYLFSIITVLISLAALSGGEALAAPLINGAGATFPYPLYSRWTYDYNKKTGVKLNYQSIGSGGGIKQIQARTVDFGASDAPMKAEELKKSGLIQFPMAVGGVVPVVNLPGVRPGALKLTPEVLAGIFLGEITRWTDERIAKDNKGLRLPDKKITVVHRSDGSGTTWIFTNYFDKVSPAWREKVGFGKAVSWPVGIGGKGNEGVATYVKRVKSSIGYVEYAYALQNKLTHTSLRNRYGVFVEPNMESFTTAAAGADWKNTPGYAVVLTNQGGEKAWPIAGATFILVQKKPENCDNAGEVLKFFDWAYREGAKTASSLDYVPIPEDVYTIMEGTWAGEIRCGGKPLWKR
jgi:phosphate transport system substrate-binding protein